MSNQLAIAPQYNELRTIMRREDTLTRFQEILDKRANGFMATVLTAVYNSPQLHDADPVSTLTAALQAAAVDLSIDPNIGYAYLVPFRDKGTKKTQLQIGYKGFIQLAYRTGEYASINVGELMAGEEIKEDRLSGRVEIVGNPTSETVVGYFAYFKLKSGLEKYLYMTVEQVTDHAKKYSQSYGKSFSAWTSNFREMALKTVIKLLLKRWGPLSIDVRQALETDDGGEPNGLATRPLAGPVDAGDDKMTVEATFDENGNIETLEGEFRDVDAKNDAGEEQKSAARPLQPADLKVQLDAWTFDHNGTNCTDKHRQLLASILNNTVGGDDNRHAVMRYLTGNASVKDVPGAYILAMLKSWLAVTGWDDAPQPDAITEARAVLHVATVSEDQPTLI